MCRYRYSKANVKRYRSQHSSLFRTFRFIDLTNIDSEWLYCVELGTQFDIDSFVDLIHQLDTPYVAALIWFWTLTANNDQRKRKINCRWNRRERLLFCTGHARVLPSLIPIRNERAKRARASTGWAVGRKLRGHTHRPSCVPCYTGTP